MKKIVYLILGLFASNFYLSGCHSTEKATVLTEDAVSNKYMGKESLILKKYKPEQNVRVTANNCDTIVPAFIARSIQVLMFKKYFADGNQGTFSSFINGQDHYSSAPRYDGISSGDSFNYPSHASHSSHSSHASHSSHYSSY